MEQNKPVPMFITCTSYFYFVGSRRFFFSQILVNIFFIGNIHVFTILFRCKNIIYWQPVNDRQRCVLHGVLKAQTLWNQLISLELKRQYHSSCNLPLIQVFLRFFLKSNEIFIMKYFKLDTKLFMASLHSLVWFTCTIRFQWNFISNMNCILLIISCSDW